MPALTSQIAAVAGEREALLPGRARNNGSARVFGGLGADGPVLAGGKSVVDRGGCALVRPTFHGVVLRPVLFALAVGSLLAMPIECPAQQDRQGRYLTVEAMNVLLDSIETLALTCEHSDAQLHRISTIAAWGLVPPRSDAPPPPPPYPGIVARLARIYGQCEGAWTRGIIVKYMSLQSEQKETAAFLAAVAQEAASQRTDTPPFTVPASAIEVLSWMGAEGRAVLQRLHAEGTVRDWHARALLEALARQGFQRLQSARHDTGPELPTRLRSAVREKMSQLLAERVFHPDTSSFKVEVDSAPMFPGVVFHTATMPSRTTDVASGFLGAVGVGDAVQIVASLADIPAAWSLTRQPPPPMENLTDVCRTFLRLVSVIPPPVKEVRRIDDVGQVYADQLRPWPPLALRSDVRRQPGEFIGLDRDHVVLLLFRCSTGDGVLRVLVDTLASRTAR